MAVAVAAGAAVGAVGGVSRAVEGGGGQWWATEAEGPSHASLV